MEGRQEEDLNRLRATPSLTSWLEGSEYDSASEPGSIETEQDLRSDRTDGSNSGGHSEQKSNEEDSNHEDDLSLTDLSENYKMSDEVEVGGMKIKLANETRVVQVEETPMFRKEDRKGLSEDKRNDLFDKATKNVLTKFDLMSLSIKDEEKLDDT